MTEPVNSPRAPAIRVILASLLEADLRVQARNGRALAVTLLLPVIVMYGLGAGKRGALFPPGSRLAVAVGLGIASVAILGYTVTVARDREAGVFQRLRVSPAPAWAIMASRLAVQVASILVMTGVVFATGAAFFGLRLEPGAYALATAVAVLGAIEFLGIGQAIVGLLKSADTVNAIGRLLYIPLFALGILGQVSVLGSTLQTVARWSPGGALIGMLSGAMAPATWSSDTWWSVAVSMAYAVVFAALGVRWFQWESR